MARKQHRDGLVGYVKRELCDSPMAQMLGSGILNQKDQPASGERGWDSSRLLGGSHSVMRLNERGRRMRHRGEGRIGSGVLV